MPHQYSVIIPTFNEEKNILKTVQSVREAGLEVEIVVVDGGSTDRTLQIIKGAGVHYYVTVQGRGNQLNLGAQKSTGDILVFLHADTLLPKDAFMVLDRNFKDAQVQVVTFQMAFDDLHWLLRCYSFMTRFESLWTTFGDQCIVTRRSFYQKCGGFPDWSLFEDVAFLSQARKLTKIKKVPQKVVTSAAKFLQNGVFHQQLINGVMICGYLWGVSPQKLHQKYYGHKNI